MESLRCVGGGRQGGESATGEREASGRATIDAPATREEGGGAQRISVENTGIPLCRVTGRGNIRNTPLCRRRYATQRKRGESGVVTPWNQESTLLSRQQGMEREGHTSQRRGVTIWPTGENGYIEGRWRTVLCAGGLDVEERGEGRRTMGAAAASAGPRASSSENLV